MKRTSSPITDAGKNDIEAYITTKFKSYKLKENIKCRPKTNK